MLYLILILHLYIQLSSTCKITEFSCTNGQCINQNKFCNGIRDCLDGSDEVRHCSPCNRTYSGDLDSSYSLNLHKFQDCEINFIGGSYDQIVQLRGISPQATTIDVFGGGGGEQINRYAFDTPFKYYSKDNTLKIILNSSYDLELIYKFMKKGKSKSRLTSTGSLLPSTYCSYIYNNCVGCLIQSPNFPGSFPFNVTCYYAIKSFGLISLKIPPKFSNGSTLTIYDGYTIMDRMLMRVENGLDLKHPIVGSAGEMLLEFWSGNGRGQPFEIKIEIMKKENFSCNEKISSLKLTKGELSSPQWTLPGNTTCKIEFDGLGKNEILKLEIYKFYIEKSDCETSYLDIIDSDVLRERLCYNSTFKACEHKKFSKNSRDCNPEESYILGSNSTNSSSNTLITIKLAESTVRTKFEYKIGYEFIKGFECHTIFDSETKFIAPKNPYKEKCNYTFVRGGRLEINEFKGYPVKIYEYAVGVRFLRGTFAKNVIFETFDKFELIVDRPVSFNGRYVPKDRGNCQIQQMTGPAGRVSISQCNNVYLITPIKPENYLYLSISSCHGLKVFSSTEETLCRQELFSKNWFNETYTDDYFVLQYNGITQVTIDYLEISKNLADCKLCPNFACISANLFCDGVENCPDGFDEKECNNSYLWMFVAFVVCLIILITIVYIWRYNVKFDDDYED